MMAVNSDHLDWLKCHTTKLPKWAEVYVPVCSEINKKFQIKTQSTIMHVFKIH